MKLKTGHEYWILTDLEHSFICGEREYYALKSCVLDYVSVEDCEVKFIFIECDDPTAIHSFFPYEMEQWLFKTVDAYLRYLVEHVEQLNCQRASDIEQYEFDDFMKHKIAASQSNNPECWV